MLRPIKERLWEKIDVRGVDECWPWKARKTVRGYGAFRVRRKDGSHTMRNASRVVYAIQHGINVMDIPSQMLICHHCDNPACCNPNHLFMGTSLDNRNDMLEKGRDNVPSGESHYLAKLTADDVIEIRRQYQSDCSQSLRKLAIKYDVTIANIHAVIQGRSWRSVTNGIPVKRS